jgi:glycosyltransferase involved in cell wall biosynthesis
MKARTILFIEFFHRSGAVNGLLAEISHIARYHPSEYRSVVVGSHGSLLEDAASSGRFVFCAVDAIQLREFYDRPWRTILQYFSAFWALIVVCARYRPSLIHCNHYEWSPYAVPLALLLRIPVIVHLKDVYKLQPKIARVLMKCYAKTYFIAVSHYTRNLFINTYRLPSSRTIMIYDGIDPDVMRTDSVTAISRKRPVVLMMSRITPERDIEVFIETAAILKRRYPHLRFVHYGVSPHELEGPYFLELLKRVSALELGSHFSFQLYESDPEKVAEILRRSSLLLVTARQFALPNIAIESQMCGTPVIAADTGGNREIVPPSNKFGILIKTNSPMLFARAIEGYIRSPGKYARASKSGRIRSGQLFSADVQYGKILGLYQSLLIDGTLDHLVL